MSKLSQLHEEILPCQRCQLARHRTRTVPGEGSENAEIMFIGEAPGYNEDQQGRPFVGAAGQFLTQLLSSINLRREQVYITNVIKCRPPGNRDPLPDEINSCRGWLDKQLEVLRPRMVVTLGRYSMGLFFPGKTISKIHGTAHNQGDIIYFAMYHPAAALHQQSLRNDIEQDMLKIPGVLAQIKNIAPAEQEPKQLNMFGD